MPLARTQYEADGSTKTFSIPFDYINKSDVIVSVDGSETTDFTWTSGSTIKFSTAPTNGTIIDVLRETERKSQLVDFQDASTLLESDLDLMAQQTFFLAQEAFDQAGATLYVKPDGSYSASTRRIGDLGDPIDPEDATNKQYVDGQLAEAESATDARIAAEHWAEHPEDVTVPEGDGSEYSAHHWANKASQDADSIATDAAQASQDADTASTAATAAEDAQSAAESAQAGVAADASAASDSASAAATSESNAGTYETQAESHRDQAKGYKNTASTQASDASDAANDAFTYKNEAEEWASKQEGVTVEGGEYSAKHYANKAGASASNAASSESAASDSETAASNSADAASASANSIGDAETNVVGYAEEAKHWANYPVDSEVPEGSVDEFSSRHWADKAKEYAEDTAAAATGVYDGIREGKKSSAPSEDAVFQEFAGLGTAAKSDDADFATSAQGDTADSALQPADVGTAAAKDTTAFASAAQGAKADSALQDASQFATAAQGDKADSALQDSDVGSAASYSYTYFATSSQGDKADSALQPSNISTGTGNSTVNVMSQKAVTDKFNTLGSAAKKDRTYFATASQGEKADNALSKSRVSSSSSGTSDALVPTQYAMHNAIEDEKFLVESDKGGRVYYQKFSDGTAVVYGWGVLTQAAGMGYIVSATRAFSALLSFSEKYSITASVDTDDPNTKNTAALSWTTRVKDVSSTEVQVVAHSVDAQDVSADTELKFNVMVFGKYV